MTRAADAWLLILSAAGSACAAPATQTACAQLPAQPAAAPSPAPPAHTPSLTLDLPAAASWSGTQTVFAVDLSAAGQMTVDGESVTSDEALQAKARLALAQHPELRAVVRADQSVFHGRVIHVVDHLKQAGISKIAFGVSVSPTPGPVVSSGPLPAMVPDANRGGSPAGLRPGASWSCAFPPEADKKGIDSALVVVTVIVGADGAPTGARVLEDPGNGFGQAALRCVVAQSYAPATDARSLPMLSTTPPIRIRFTR